MYLKKESRAKLGKKMDNYLRENIQNEEIFWSVWASMGMPDGATEDDYEDLKESDEFWTDCLEAFMRCVLLDAENHNSCDETLDVTIDGISKEGFFDDNIEWESPKDYKGLMKTIQRFVKYAAEH